jgi:D-arabinose 1-dehydrogenase-like Zn-dependent alcohol dehydrogenase
MPKMRAALIARPAGPFEIVEREIPQPGAGWVRIKVQACGICHSDSLVKEGHWPGLKYPRVPGHEIVGVVDALGTGVSQWKPGQRVGVGWHGGHCGNCDACRSGNFFGCQVALQITGISFDGGYADYMIAPAIALALVPEDLSAVEAAPLMSSRAPFRIRQVAAHNCQQVLDFLRTALMWTQPAVIGPLLQAHLRFPSRKVSALGTRK